MLKATLILFLLILFPVIGGGVVVSSIAMLGKADEARDWPTVRGRILSSEVVAELRSNFGSPGRSSSNRKPTKVYSARVRYEYVVDGQTYVGDRISFQGGPSTDRHQAESTAARFDQDETTVYYNPENPEDALLSPAETGDIFVGLVFGAVLMIVPPGLILLGLRYEFIPRPELPLHFRLWWNLKFGKHANAGNDQRTIEAPSRPAAAEGPTTGGNAPVDEEFLETIVTWQPKRRIELSRNPDAIWMYLLMSAAVGLILAWVGMFPVTHAIYRRENPHLPELGTVFGFLLLTSSSIIFLVCRFWERGSKTIVDWQAGLIRSEREFSFSRLFGIGDVRRVLVRCIPVKGRHRRFRAWVELDVDGEHLLAARTRRPRRKPEVAKETALNLAQPLADSLGVPVEFAGFDP